MSDLIAQGAKYAFMHLTAEDANVARCVSEIKDGMQREESIEAQLGMFRSYAGCPPYADGPYLTPQLEKAGFKDVGHVRQFFRDGSIYSIRRIIQDARNAMAQETPDAPLVFSPSQRIDTHLLAVDKIDGVEERKRSEHRAQVLSECGTSSNEVISLDQDFQKRRAARPARSLPRSLRS